ncbi:MOSC domain-containing protein [Bacillus piscicola]|uniref:MOSC domain-containing protein n=1 Tax=Bacillus piscicola TaxID=1632684 RepID=UPI001F08B213
MSHAIIKSLWRYPVKSMMGEELNACEITEKGVLGDRSYGVIDEETGKLANAKNPLKWPTMFQHRATFTEPPQLMSSSLPPVRITCPDGTMTVSSDEKAGEVLTKSFNRTVTVSTPESVSGEFEGYVPEGIDGLANPGSVFSKDTPQGTFFDIGMVHIVTTSSLETLKRLAPDSRIEARRFRPNLIIDVPNADGFIENEWVGRTLSIGDDVQLKIIQPTKRCVMTTLAQGDLPHDSNVLKSAFNENEGNIGVYASIISGGSIRIGDRVIISK